VYWPLLQAHFESEDISLRRSVAFILRSPRAGSEGLLKNVRETVWSVNANLSLADVAYARLLLWEIVSAYIVHVDYAGGGGAMALLLGVVGIYGVIAYSVSQRTREIGVRMALGAQRPTVTKMFVRQGLLLTGFGVAAGLVAAVLVMRLMSSLLFKVNPTDPITYAAVSVGLVGTAWLASYVPSRRAATVDPVESVASRINTLCSARQSGNHILPI